MISLLFGTAQWISVIEKCKSNKKHPVILFALKEEVKFCSLEKQPPERFYKKVVLGTPILNNICERLFLSFYLNFNTNAETYPKLQQMLFNYCYKSLHHRYFWEFWIGLCSEIFVTQSLKIQPQMKFIDSKTFNINSLLCINSSMQK